MATAPILDGANQTLALITSSVDATSSSGRSEKGELQTLIGSTLAIQGQFLGQMKELATTTTSLAQQERKVEELEKGLTLLQRNVDEQAKTVQTSQREMGAGIYDLTQSVKTVQKSLEEIASGLKGQQTLLTQVDEKTKPLPTDLNTKFEALIKRIDEQDKKIQRLTDQIVVNQFAFERYKQPEITDFSIKLACGGLIVMGCIADLMTGSKNVKPEQAMWIIAAVVAYVGVRAYNVFFDPVQPSQAVLEARARLGLK